MSISKQEEKALFRFQIIFPLTDGTLSDGKRSRMVEEICSREYTIPHSTKTTLSPSTVWKWYRAYMEQGTIDSLAPKGRSDKGGRRKISPDALAELLKRYRESDDGIPMKAIVQKAIEDGVLGPDDTISMGAIYQIFKKERNGFNPKEKDRRAFRAPTINGQWQSDAMHGLPVKLNDGRTITPRMFACIDNRSRLICYAAWYRTETAECYMDCLWNAFRLRGLPKVCFYDNGSAFRDDRIKLGCASLGVNLVYARPYSPESKGVIERFNRTVRQQFLSMLPKEPITLDELNVRFEKWVGEYNRRPHSSLDGQSPLQCYLSELKGIVPAPENLPLYFRRRETRLVKADRTLSLNNIAFEAPLGYSGRKLELRYFDSDPAGTCEAFFDGKSLGMLHPVDREANYAARRKEAGR